jgi:hypothetical protein
MRRAGSAFLLAGALLLLASLYVPWQRESCGSRCLGGSLTVDGWSSGVGPAAALFALLLAAVAAVALARPDLSDRLALGRCALVAGYFGLAVAAQARSVAQERAVALKAIHFHYAYGAYLGIAGAIVVLLVPCALRRRELERYRSVSGLASLVLAVGLLVAFLLPWVRFPAPAGVTGLGIASPAAVVAAACTVCSWPAGPAARAERLVLTVAAALFTGAAFSSITYPDGSHAYGAWIGLGSAGLLVAVALLDGVRVPAMKLPPLPALATCGAAALLVTALFLPWQTVCYGRCVSVNGWTTAAGPAAAVLAIALVIVTLAPRRLAVSATALAAGIGLLVATLGFELVDEPDLRLGYGYGSTVGFAGAALLLVLAVLQLRLPAFDRKRAAVRLAPIAASAAYLVVVVLPWWGVLPLHVQLALRFAPLSWLTIAGVLGVVWLLRLWVRQAAGAPAGVEWLVVIPLALLGLAALDLIRLRAAGVTWGNGAVVGCCVLLALLGRVEQRVGLENLRVPELLRVDRL